MTLRDVSAAEVQASFEKLAREQKLAFKEQEHLDDLQNIEILRQTYYQLHVRLLASLLHAKLNYDMCPHFASSC